VCADLFRQFLQTGDRGLAQMRRPEPSRSRRRVGRLPSTLGVTPSNCRIVVQSEQGATIYALHGEIDAMTATDVRHSLGLWGSGAVILDLTEIRSIDDVGLDTLRDIIRSVHEEGGLVAIAHARRATKPILQLVGTAGFVYLAYSSTGALEWLMQHPQFRFPERPEGSPMDLGVPVLDDEADALLDPDRIEGRQAPDIFRRFRPQWSTVDARWP
jgi:anti-anti-sigma factor